jgi:predicted nucleic acid-binding protein
MELSETLVTKFGWPEDRVEEARERIFRNAWRVEPRCLSGVVRDCGDEHVIAAALEADARLIVMGDKDLLVLFEFRGVQIVTPAVFLDSFLNS